MEWPRLRGKKKAGEADKQADFVAQKQRYRQQTGETAKLVCCEKSTEDI